MMTSSADAAPAEIAVWSMPELRAAAPGTVAGQAAAAADQAYDRGWAEGHAAALAEAERRVNTAVRTLEAAASGLDAAAFALQARLPSTVHALAVAIAQHVIGHEVAGDPELMNRLLTRAIALAPLGGQVTVRVHPDDLAALRAVGRMPEALESIELRWTPDPAIGRGGCLVETATSIVDGRLDRMLYDIYERLGHD